MQYLAGQRYAAQWRAYLATLDGPRRLGGSNGHGGASRCLGCPTAGDREKCTCDLAKRLWRRSTLALAAVGPEAVQMIARVACWDVPCPPWALAVLRSGLDALAESLGLTSKIKSRHVENLNPNYALMP